MMEKVTGVRFSVDPNSTVEKPERDKISNGYTFSDEHRRKLSEAHKGKPISAETRKKMSDAKKGRVFTEEHKKNLSIAGKKRVERERLMKSMIGD